MKIDYEQIDCLNKKERMIYDMRKSYDEIKKYVSNENIELLETNLEPLFDYNYFDKKIFYYVLSNYIYSNELKGGIEEVACPDYSLADPRYKKNGKVWQYRYLRST